MVKNGKGMRMVKWPQGGMEKKKPGVGRELGAAATPPTSDGLSQWFHDLFISLPLLVKKRSPRSQEEEAHTKLNIASSHTPLWTLTSSLTSLIGWTACLIHFHFTLVVVGPPSLHFHLHFHLITCLSNSSMHLISSDSNCPWKSGKSPHHLFQMTRNHLFLHFCLFISISDMGWKNFLFDWEGEGKP